MMGDRNPTFFITPEIFQKKNDNKNTRRSMYHLVFWVVKKMVSNLSRSMTKTGQQLVKLKETTSSYVFLGGIFRYFFIFTPTWGNDPI